MRKFSLNSARTYVGRNVNLHLKDGSVIINVLVTDAQPNGHDGGPTLQYMMPTKKKTMKVSLEEVEWAERLYPYILLCH